MSKKLWCRKCKQFEMHDSGSQTLLESLEAQLGESAQVWIDLKFKYQALEAQLETEKQSNARWQEWSLRDQKQLEAVRLLPEKWCALKVTGIKAEVGITYKVCANELKQACSA